MTELGLGRGFPTACGLDASRVIGVMRFADALGEVRTRLGQPEVWHWPRLWW